MKGRSEVYSGKDNGLRILLRKTNKTSLYNRRFQNIVTLV